MNYLISRDIDNDGYPEFIQDMNTMALTEDPSRALQFTARDLEYIDMAYMNSLGFYAVEAPRYGISPLERMLFKPPVRAYRPPVAPPPRRRGPGAAPRPMPHAPAGGPINRGPVNMGPSGRSMGGPGGHGAGGPGGHGAGGPGGHGAGGPGGHGAGGPGGHGAGGPGGRGMGGPGPGR